MIPPINKPGICLALTMLCGLFLMGCDDDDLCLRGSGQVAQYELDFDSFDEISLSGPINLSITQGPVQSVMIEAEPELFGPMEYEVRNDQLEIGYRKNVSCFNTSVGVWVYVTLPDIDEINVSGESIIVSDGNLDLDELEIEISGRAEVNLTGTIDIQRIEVSGSAEIQNLLVDSKSVFLEVDGSADTEFSCSDLLDISVRGSAYVGYKGQPQIRQDISGSLDLVNLN